MAEAEAPTAVEVCACLPSQLKQMTFSFAHCCPYHVRYCYNHALCLCTMASGCDPHFTVIVILPRSEFPRTWVLCAWCMDTIAHTNPIQMHQSDTWCTRAWIETFEIHGSVFTANYGLSVPVSWVLLSRFHTTHSLSIDPCNCPAANESTACHCLFAGCLS